MKGTNDTAQVLAEKKESAEIKRDGEEQAGETKPHAVGAASQSSSTPESEEAKLQKDKKRDFAIIIASTSLLLVVIVAAVLFFVISSLISGLSTQSLGMWVAPYVFVGAVTLCVAAAAGAYVYKVSKPEVEKASAAKAITKGEKVAEPASLSAKHVITTKAEVHSTLPDQEQSPDASSTELPEVIEKREDSPAIPIAAPKESSATPKEEVACKQSDGDNVSPQSQQKHQEQGDGNTSDQGSGAVKKQQTDSLDKSCTNGSAAVVAPAVPSADLKSVTVLQEEQKDLTVTA